MAGHSKWANTKHRKSIKDMKKSKIFTKLIRDIVTAAKIGGSNNPENNPKLRVAMNKALLSNMTRNTINKALSHQNHAVKENYIYEGYWDGGIAIIIDCVTDNRNRTVSEIRYAFNKGGGNLSNCGSVSYLFQKKGILVFNSKMKINDIISKSLELNIENFVRKKNGNLEIITSYEALYSTKNVLENYGYMPEIFKIKMIPVSTIEINQNTYLKLRNLLALLKHCKDVKNIYHNAHLI